MSAICRHAISSSAASGHVAAINQRHRWHSARPRAAAYLLRATGKPAYSRTSRWKKFTGALPGQGRRAVDRVLQSAPIPRILRALKRVPFPKDMISFHGRGQQDTSNFVEHPKWWRAASRKPLPPSATASASSPRRIAASAPSPGANGVIGAGGLAQASKPIRQGADIASARLWGKKSAA